MSTLSTSAHSANRGQLANALWAALAQVGALECDRDGLPDCSSFALDLCVTGTINGEPVEQLIAGTLDVGTLRRKPCRKSDVEAANRLLSQLRRSQRPEAANGLKCRYTTVPSLSKVGKAG